MHTILGAGGPVANAVSKHLQANNSPLRLISRKEVEAGGNTTWKKANLLDLKSLRQAAAGSKVIYLCAGLVYDHKLWAQQWPVIMTNVITLAKENDARLLFFDNVYMYGRVEGAMREATLYNPISKKGEIRARIATMLEDEWKAGNVRGSIARAADFYGSESGGSLVDQLVLSPLSKDKKPSWLGDPRQLHSLTKVDEAGKAMFMLGQDPQTDNQIWHMPTADAIPGLKFLEIATKVFGGSNGANFTTLNYFMLFLAGIFTKTIRETQELYYQYKYDYLFNSDKFNAYFGYKPVGYEDGIKTLAMTLYHNRSK